MLLEGGEGGCPEPGVVKIELWALGTGRPSDRNTGSVKLLAVPNFFNLRKNGILPKIIQIDFFIIL